MPALITNLSENDNEIIDIHWENIDLKDAIFELYKNCSEGVSTHIL